MIKRVVYEWFVEEVDQYGDIDNVSHFPTLAEIMQYVADIESQEGWTIQIGIVRDYCFDGDGWSGSDRSWAYFKNGKLSEYFLDTNGDETIKVPKRFYQEAMEII